ncbi:hypothetical protein HanPI659440_Chr13g0500121 [Helianthus annuus]|nr:hypothetical protein HanPI659440_Chr13g0500121 [Helianthus annuus]
MELADLKNYLKKIKSFIYGSILASGSSKGIKFLKSIICIQKDQSWPEEESKWLKRLIEAESNDQEPDHLLHLLHGRLTKTFKVPTNDTIISKNVRCNFRNVSELVDVGINFKPSNTRSSTRIEFLKGWWWFSANVALPPITVNDSTKHILLNLMAYEACRCSINDAWVTSYVCLLDSLIDDADDVKVLRKAWVIENALSGDKEVAKVFKEIAIDLVPNKLAYLEAKNKIQRHYESLRNTLFSQLKNEYFKNPWAFFALLGALIALFLSGVQTYFTVWSPKGTCDDLCMFLKMNHHL